MPEGVYGLSGPRPSGTMFRRLVFSYRPVAYFPGDDVGFSGARNIADAYHMSSATASVVYRAAKVASGLTERGMAVSNGQGLAGTITYNTPNPHTMGIWIAGYIEEGSGGSIFGNWDGNGQMIYHNGTATRYYSGANYVNVSYELDGGLNFLVGTHDGTNLSLYRNGTLVAGPTAYAWDAGNHPLSINRHTDAYRGGNFRWSDAFVLPVALTATQIMALYVLGR